MLFRRFDLKHLLVLSSSVFDLHCPATASASLLDIHQLHVALSIAIVGQAGVSRYTCTSGEWHSWVEDECPGRRGTPHASLVEQAVVHWMGKLRVPVGGRSGLGRLWGKTVSLVQLGSPPWRLAVRHCLRSSLCSCSRASCGGEGMVFKGMWIATVLTDPDSERLASHSIGVSMSCKVAMPIAALASASSKWKPASRWCGTSCPRTAKALFRHR